MTNNTVELNIATANTSKATKDVKSLKEQIRDLKNEMAQLTEDTEEYNAAAIQLGNLMHQQQEITEAAKLATQDYEQVLSNITSVSAGVVGSISAMNGVMNLMGASSDDALEAMRKIQSLMAIVQGLSQLKEAEKSFKDLMTRLKALITVRKQDTQEEIKETVAGAGTVTSMKAQTVASNGLTVALKKVGLGFKSLRLAMKSFMMSNPLTAILTVALTIYEVVSSIANKAKEAAEKAEELARNLRSAGTEAINASIGSSGYGASTYRQIGEEQYRLYPGNKRLDPADEEGRKEYDRRLDEHKRYLKNLEDQDKKFTEDYRNRRQQLYNTQREYIANVYNYWTQQVLKNKNWMNQQDKDTREKMQKAYDEAVDMQNYYWEQLGQRYEEWSEYERNFAENKDAYDKRKAKEWLQLQKEKNEQALADLRTHYDYVKAETDRLYKTLDLTEEQYYDRSIEELNDYIKKWTAEKMKQAKVEDPSKLTEADLLELRKLNNQLIDLERAKTSALVSLRKQLADAENYRPDSAKSRVNEAYYDQKQNELMNQTGQRYLEQQEELYNAWWWKKFRLMEEYNQREIEEERAHNDELNQLAMERYEEEERVLKENRRGDEGYEVQRFQDEMNNLRDQLENKLITQQEFDLKEEELERQHLENMWNIRQEYEEGMREVDNQRTETLRDIAQQRFEIEQDYYNRRMELDQAYISAYQSINSAISGILAQALQGAKEGTKEYEQIQEASIIMDTISGSLAAFMSGVKSGIPAPYNFILGGVLSLAALAEGKMALDNLHSKKLSSGASNAPSVSAYQTFVSETGADLQGDIQDQRVVVLEQDITDTVNRVNVVESESTF